MWLALESRLLMTLVWKKPEVTKSHKVKEKGQKITKEQIIPKDLKTTTRRKIKITGEAQKVGERKRKTTVFDDDDEQPADKVTGGERPLGEKLQDGFEVKLGNGSFWNLTGALELHRLVLEDYDQLEKRKKEITSKIIDSTCAFDYSGLSWIKVSQPPLPLLRRSRHCSWHVSSDMIKQRFCS